MVKNTHPDKYEEFKKNFDEIKKTAVIKESTTRTEVTGPEPPKIVEKEKPPEPPKEPPKEPEKKKEGDGASKHILIRQPAELMLSSSMGRALSIQ
ncbi:MAG TPA: hypothetical protein VKL21_05870, partial [Candidatus Methanoperedens sp.]|nr:hypothetical protein [Candidatus Methanoperedens sp.]